MLIREKSMASQTECSTNDLIAEIARLNQTNEILNRQLIKAWRDVAHLQDTNSRLFNENQELIQRLPDAEFDREPAGV